MPQSAAPVRVRVRVREPGQDAAAQSREWIFWRSLKQTGVSDRSVSSLEGELERELGPRLRERLIERVADGYRRLDSEMFGGRAFRWIDEFFHFGTSKDRDPYRAQVFDTLARIAEAREASQRESAAVRQVRDKLALAGQVFFSARIQGYGSLDLSLGIAPLDNVAKIFDFDVAALEVFLAAYLPDAFGSIFTQDFANQLAFEVNIPDSIAGSFRQARSNDGVEPRRTMRAGPADTRSVLNETQRRTELLWKVANGSLLLPVILALVVMLYGFRELSAIQRSQLDALRPVLEHQAALLREDRERMVARGSVPPAGTRSTDTSVTQRR